MSEKLNPSPKIPDGEYPELSPNPNFTDGYIQGEHGTPVRINTAPQKGIRQEPEPTNFAELYVGGKAPLTEIPEIPTGTKLYQHLFNGGNVIFVSNTSKPITFSSERGINALCINTSAYENFMLSIICVNISGFNKPVICKGFTSSGLFGYKLFDASAGQDITIDDLLNDTVTEL